MCDKTSKQTNIGLFLALRGGFYSPGGLSQTLEGRACCGKFESTVKQKVTHMPAVFLFQCLLSTYTHLGVDVVHVGAAAVTLDHIHLSETKLKAREKPSPGAVSPGLHLLA